MVSDHGFSTIRRSIDLRKILSDAGFIAKTEFDGQPKPGDIMLVGNGGSVLFMSSDTIRRWRAVSSNFCSNRILLE